MIRLPLNSTDVDAFSLPFADHPVVVLGADKNDRAQSRFDCAHELGHLVMHGEQIWGIKEVETQAHRFAAALLIPAGEIRNQLPTAVDSPRLFELKRRWQVSLAALLMRARTLGCMSESTYLTAVKAASARGWRRVEPVPLGPPEEPTLLLNFLAATASQPARTYLPEKVVDNIIAATHAALPALYLAHTDASLPSRFSRYPALIVLLQRVVVGEPTLLQRALWHADTIRGMIRRWMPHWCWASKVGW